jgi:hypothetical protein
MGKRVFEGRWEFLKNKDRAEIEGYLIKKKNKIPILNLVLNCYILTTSILFCKIKTQQNLTKSQHKFNHLNKCQTKLDLERKQCK